MANKLDARQMIVRDLLSHIGNGLSNVEIDNLMRAINSDLYPLLRLDSDGASTITVQASSKVNPELSRKTEIPPINGVIPIFTTGTITFPADNTGSITVLPGSAVSLSGPLGVNSFMKVGIHLKSDGDLAVTLGVEGASAALAAEPFDLPDALFIGKVLIETDGLGVIQAISQSDVSQFPVANQSSAFSAIQDRNMQLIDGGVWYWDQNGANPDELSWSANAWIQIPGMEDNYNQILLGNVTLLDGEMAYVNLNRTTLSATNLPVQVTDFSSFTPTNNTFVVARRLGSVVYVAESMRLEPDTYGRPDAWVREIDKKLGALKLQADPVNLDEATISGATIVQDDGRTLQQELANRIIDFTGGSINFTTGVVTGANGTNFAPFAIPVGEYFWYGISMSPDVIGSDNKVQPVITVTPATDSNIVAGNAPRPLVQGTKKIGAVQVHNSLGTISVVAIEAFGADTAAPDGEGPIVTVDPGAGFAMAFTDDFPTGPENAETYVREAETNANHNLAKEMYELMCDSTPVFDTAAASSTVTLDVAPSFTVQEGDIIYVDSLSAFARITTVNTQQSFDVDNPAWTALAFSAQAGVISQAVWTNDITQDTGDASQNTRPMDFFPSKAITNVQVDYFDSVAVDDGVPDFIDQAAIAVSVSNEGIQGASDAVLPTADQYSPISERVAAPNQIVNYPLSTNTNQERLWAVFFANPNNAAALATGQVNLIKYKLSFYEEDNLIKTGGILNSAYTAADGTGTEINCLAPTSEANSLMSLDFQYAQGVNVGETQGDLTVVVDGEQIPREVVGSTAGKFYYEEPGNNKAIRFWTDITALGPVNVEVYRRQGSVDSADQNLIDLGFLQESQHVNFSIILPRMKYQRILTDTSGGAITITLPPAPFVGDRVMIQDGTSSALSFNVTVDRNGELIETAAVNDTINVNREWVEYEFYGAGQGWIVRR